MAVCVASKQHLLPLFFRQCCPTILARVRNIHRSHLSRTARCYALWSPLTGHQARIRESLLKAKLSDSEQLIAYMKSS